jgi:hypothetical protein
MPTQSDQAAILASVFACSGEAADAALGIARWSRFSRGEALAHQGDESGQCHLVISGIADMKALGTEGQYVQLATLEPVDLFGAYPEKRTNEAEQCEGGGHRRIDLTRFGQIGQRIPPVPRRSVRTGPALQHDPPTRAAPAKRPAAAHRFRQILRRRAIAKSGGWRGAFFLLGQRHHVIDDGVDLSVFEDALPRRHGR